MGFLDTVLGFFRRPDVKRVVEPVKDVAVQAGKEAADAAADAAVERAFEKLRQRINESSRLTGGEKARFLAAVDGVEAAVKAAYGDGR